MSRYKRMAAVQTLLLRSTKRVDTFLGREGEEGERGHTHEEEGDDEVRCGVVWWAWA
jgi:hypothetical protein